MKFKKLIIVGDPHITAKNGSQRGVDSAEVLRKLVSHVNQHHSDAELCLFLGDMTNEGEPEAYTRFRTLIEPLAVPFKLMIGNHDHRQNFQEAFPDNPKDANGFVQFIHDFENQYRLIALDTLNGPPYDELRRHVGMLSEDRLAYLKESLTGAEGRPVIIAMHHQPFRIGLPGMDLIRLLNGDEFIQLVKQYPNVEMLLFGHNHRQITGVAHKIPFVCFKSLTVQTPLDFKKVDPSGGIAEPPCYGVAMLTEHGVIIHQEDFTADGEPSSDFEEQLANNPQMKAGIQILSKMMLPEM